ncbi:MAG TPA: hypothetical protein V6D17_18070 [Candidatus Obscuribacterales bacterium]
MRTTNQFLELDTARQLALDMGYQLSDDDEPADEPGAAGPKKPVLPEGGNEVALPEPENESE